MVRVMDILEVIFMVNRVAIRVNVKPFYLPAKLHINQNYTITFGEQISKSFVYCLLFSMDNLNSF